MGAGDGVRVAMRLVPTATAAPATLEVPTESAMQKSRAKSATSAQEGTFNLAIAPDIK